MSRRAHSGAANTQREYMDVMWSLESESDFHTGFNLESGVRPPMEIFDTKILIAIM